MLIVISQLAVAYLIELFGLFGVEQQPCVEKSAGNGDFYCGDHYFQAARKIKNGRLLL